MSDDLSPDDLQRLFAANQPVGNDFLITPTGRPLVAGSSVPAVGSGVAVSNSGLALVGRGAAAPTDFVGTYITLNEFLDRDPALLSEALISMYPAEVLLEELAYLNHAFSKAEIGDAVTAKFADSLVEPSATRLRNALQSDDPARQLCSRREILGAMRRVVLEATPRTAFSGAAADLPPLPAAILLTCAVATPREKENEGDPTIAGVDADLFRELLVLGTYGEHDDIVSVLDRTKRLWVDRGDALERFPLREWPVVLLKEATGLEFDEIVALGFGMLTHAMQLDEMGPRYLRADMGSALPYTTKSGFGQLVGSDFDSLRAALEQHETLFPFQERPVLIAEGGYLVLDELSLFDRFTKGLYWFVHDHEKATQGESARQRWTQAFGEMVETLVEESLARLAPPSLDGTFTTYFTESDIRSAYDGRACDALVDLGTEFVGFEIVSGQLRMATRISGDLDSFDADTDRLVLTKCEQVNGAGLSVLNDETPLTSMPVQRSTLVPVLVVGGGYPMNPFIRAFIEEQLEARELLRDARFGPLCVVDLGEIEILEALAERGVAANDVLRAWQASGLAAVSLRNFVITDFGTDSDDPLRPSRMKGNVDVMFERMIEVLRLEQP